MAGDHAFHERLHLIAARHVAARGARELEAAAAQSGRRGLPRLAVQVGDNDGGSLCEQPLRRRQPDAGGAAGDQGDLALEPAAARAAGPLAAGRHSRRTSPAHAPPPSTGATKAPWSSARLYSESISSAPPGNP